MNAAAIEQALLASSKYFSLSLVAFVVLVYDAILTFPREVTHIWSSPWSYTKILFVLVRYITIIDTIINIHNQTAKDVTFCNITIQISSVLIGFHQICAEVILALRTWAVWGRNKRVGALLLILTVANIVVQSTLMAMLDFKYAPQPSPEFKGCNVVSVVSFMWIGYLSWCLFHTAVLILMISSGYQAYKHGQTQKLSMIIYSEGIFVYFYLFALDITNGILFRLGSSNTHSDIAPLGYIMYSVFSARIVLSIREACSEQLGVESASLHTSWEDEDQFETTSGMVGGLRFRKASESMP